MTLAIDYYKELENKLHVYVYYAERNDAGWGHRENHVKPLMIDLGCGKNKLSDAFGFDCRLEPGVNTLCDIERPLPLKNDSVDLVHLSHVMEHMRDLIAFMEEVYRVCKPGAEVCVARTIHALTLSLTL